MISQNRHSAVYYRWLIFWILALGYILVYFHRLCPAVMAVDMMADLKTGGALTGFLASAYFYPYAMMQLPAGLLSDSWGPRNTITAFFFVACVGSIILGLATSAGMAIFGRALVGLGVAMLFVPTLKILSAWFVPKEFAQMTGILMAMGGIGSLSAASPLVWLNSVIGWRYSFIWVGVATCILGIMVWTWVRDTPSKKGWPDIVHPLSSSNQPISLMTGLKTVISSPYFWPVAIWFFFTCGIFFTVGGLWGGPFLTHVYGMNRFESGRILSMLAIGMIVGSPLLSYLSTHVVKGRKPVFVVSAIMMMGITGILTVFIDQLPKISLYLIFLGIGIFSSAIVVIGFTATKELFPVQIAGTATGLVNLFPFAGGAIMQPFTGYLLERQGRMADAFTVSGYRSLFAFMLISSVIAFLACLKMKESFKHH
ncbi:MAG: MFS transporter [Desulfatirhabdiaceae bacterium]